MKKIKFLLVASLLLLTLFMGACSFNVSLSGCIEKKEEPLPEVMPASSFTLTIEEMSGLEGYYTIVFKGELFFDYYPEKITVSVDDNEYEVIPSSVRNSTNYYAFKFKPHALTFGVKEGEHDVHVYGYINGEARMKPEKAVLVADDDYLKTSVTDINNNKVIIALDKESNWSPPID